MAKRSRDKSGKGGEPPRGEGPRVIEVPFHTTTRRKYLNYAISVITARALPDVRDGLKPVQRRILFSMRNDQHLTPAVKPVKCASIVGDVLGKYHPHGDTAIYDALVRMAQGFSLRYPLVDGHGNFGSLDGDNAAAYRYTEARLQPLAMELLEELAEETVDLRPTFDGKKSEPVVLPARIPHLLANGATGIAVGMATNIPPHNLAEVAAACEALIDDRSLSVSDLLRFIKGPDFPIGGQILASRSTLREMYTQGQGSFRLRAEYKLENAGRGGGRLIVTSIPYLVQKDTLVRAIGDLIFQRKLPQLADVRDESTTDVRIVLELKKDADPTLVMAFLFKHTQLQTNFSVNLTCLVPTEKPDICAPARVDLKTMLIHFIDFRYAVVERRFRHELRLLQERIHILEGFRKLFNALDEAIKIIRGADGREEAAAKLKARFKLDTVQVDAILDLRLYKLAKLEIKAILDELNVKKARVAEIEAILARPKKLWGVVSSEIAEVRKRFGDPRRTRIAGQEAAGEAEYDEEAFIVDEDAYILLSRDGWIKRVGRVGDLSKVRLRPEDELLAVAGGNTKCTVAFFSNLGSAYTMRINDIPPSRGYGDPIQRFFKFRDGEKVVGALSFDPRCLTEIESDATANGDVPKRHALAISSSGYSLRFALHPFVEASTRAGRKFARLREGEEVMGLHVVEGDETVILASRSGRVILFPAAEVNFLSGAGRGVIAIKLAGGDRVIGSTVTRQERKGLRVYTAAGRKIEVNPGRYRVTSRGGKGVEVIKRGGLSRVEAGEITMPELGGKEEGGQNGGGSGEENGGEE